MTMKEYTKEFYILNIRDSQRERDEETVSRYINDMRYEIQDDINMMIVRTVADVYQIALEAEENLARRRFNKIEVDT
jgi:hypothetical protein